MPKDIHLSQDIVDCISRILTSREEASSLFVAAKLHRGEYLVKKEMEALARHGKIVLKEGTSADIVYAVKVPR